MRAWSIRLLDWLDHYLLGHRWPRVCCWLADHPWWHYLPPEMIDGHPVWRGWVPDTAPPRRRGVEPEEERTTDV